MADNFEKDYLEKRIREDKKTLEDLTRKEQNDNAAEQLRDLYQSLVDKGFTEEQAFYLFYEMVKAALDRN